MHAHKRGILRSSTKQLLVIPLQPLILIPEDKARKQYEIYPEQYTYEVSEPGIIPLRNENGIDVICVVLNNAQ